MRRNFIWSSAFALAVAISSVSHADIVVDMVTLNFEDSGPSLGDALEAATSSGFDSVTFPLSFLVDDEGDIAVPGTEALTVTILSAQGDGGAADFDGSTSSFGIHSPGADSTQRFDANNNEQVEISFDQPVNINSINFGFLGGSDVFQVGTRLVTTADLIPGDFSNNVIFDDPIFVAADTPLLLTATVGNVSIEQFELDVLAVPEPSSILSLMGLAGLLAVKRRR